MTQPLGIRHRPMGHGGWFDALSTGVGYVGAGVIAVAYFLNQRGVLRSGDWRYPATNLCGSALVMVSLLVHPNTPSIAIEAFWSAISLYGIQHSLRTRRRASLGQSRSSDHAAR